jgi:HAD superfamily hydrolase (TIGR01484 family)
MPVHQSEIRLIVTDLDGTLLRTDKSISSFTLSVFDECRRKGIKIAVATGRAEKAAERYIKELRPDILIVSSGALAIADGEIVYRRMLPVQTAD